MKTFILCFLLFLALTVRAQDTGTQEEPKEKEKISFRDSLDNQFDLSDVVLKKKGFIPVPVIITEPALGGFGGGLAPVFIKPNMPKTVNGKVYPSAPDLSALMAGYTLNGTWGVGGFHSGNIKKWDLKYTVGTGYLNVNMDFYFSLDKIGKELSYEFNNKSIPVFLSISKTLKNPNFSIGLNYMFLNSKLKIKNHKESGEWIDQIYDEIGDYLSGHVGRLVLKTSFDTRDNIFTPNKGLKLDLSAGWSNPVVGSDYKYGQFEQNFYWYQPLSDKLVNGFRLNFQQTTGDQPFYLKPFVDMRGIPVARYQGKYALLAEIEERWDFTRRWSLVAFGGLGKAFEDFGEFSDADWASGYGGGFRYLMARKLSLRMGLDLAVSQGDATFYIVFGSAWLR